VTVGWVFASTGWGKLHNLPKIIDYFRELQIPYPELQASFASANEFVCGVLGLVALATRLAALPLIAVMFVAIRTAEEHEETVRPLRDSLGAGNACLSRSDRTWRSSYGDHGS